MVRQCLRGPGTGSRSGTARRAPGAFRARAPGRRAAGRRAPGRERQEDRRPRHRGRSGTPGPARLRGLRKGAGSRRPRRGPTVCHCRQGAVPGHAGVRRPADHVRRPAARRPSSRARQLCGAGRGRTAAGAPARPRPPGPGRLPAGARHHELRHPTGGRLPAQRVRPPRTGAERTAAAARHPRPARLLHPRCRPERHPRPENPWLRAPLRQVPGRGGQANGRGVQSGQGRHNGRGQGTRPPLPARHRRHRLHLS